MIIARFGWIWLTVACLGWMLISLAGAFASLVRWSAPHTRAEEYLVVLPVSVFTGWIAIAMFANTAAALKASGWSDVGLSEASWTVVALLVVGALGAWITRISRGNAGYALTILWALVGIVVANWEPSRRPVAVAAGIMAVVVALALLFARTGHRARAQTPPLQGLKQARCERRPLEL